MMIPIKLTPGYISESMSYSFTYTSNINGVTALAKKCSAREKHCEQKTEAVSVLLELKYLIWGKKN